MMDQGMHQERNSDLASCQGKLNSPWSTGTQPGEDHVPVQPRSLGPVRFPAACGSQLFKASGSSLAVLCLCSPWLAESRENPSATGLLPFLQLSSAQQVSLLSAYPLAQLCGAGCWALGLPSSQLLSFANEIKPCFFVKQYDIHVVTHP